MRRLLSLCLFTLFAFPADAQWNTDRTGRQPLASGAAFVYKGILSGIPSTCNLGDIAFITDATAGQNIYECKPANTWTQQLNSGGAVSSVFGRTGAVTGQSADYSGIYEVPLTFSSPLSRATNVISIPLASGSANGYLSSGDWTTFNGKQAALGFTPVANTVTVNGHALSSNVTVSASDLTTGTLPHAQLPALVSGDIPWTTPGTIGSGTANSGAFTTLSASGTVSGSGFSTYLASPPAIGGTAAAAGSFTTLSASGAVTLSPASANIAISPTGTGTVTISPAGALTINPTAASTINNTSIGATTATTGRFTTVTSTQATGTAPFTVTSTTNVANLSASSLNGATFAAPGAIGSTTPGTAKFTTITETNLLLSNAAPTISSGFGTSPSISANNGTAAFRVNVGTGGTATSGVIGMPTATTGWNCNVDNFTAAGAHVAYNTRQTASTTTSVTVENQTTSTGAAVAWAASNILQLSCFAY